MNISGLLNRLPAASWAREYNKQQLSDDGLAAVIVTIMLIPQSLAYALLAGLPPQMGLYASISPLIAYALFGSSRVLAVGPVAVVSLMTAATLGKLGLGDDIAALTEAAVTLAFISGVMMAILGMLRAGVIANFLSHPVISGFITASGVLIAISQLKHILGIKVSGHNLPEIVGSLFSNLGNMNIITAIIGVLTVAFLFWVRKGLKPLLLARGMSKTMADVGAKAGPVLSIVVMTSLVWIFSLDENGVKIVGEIPMGLPPMTMPSFDPALWATLAPSAFLISLIGFVESISIAQTLAAKERQRIEPNFELAGLGAANIAAAMTSGYPVTGGFARSVVNYDAGAKTPLAGVFTAGGILLTALLLTPLFYYLPNAVLAATIIVAVLSIVDIDAIKHIYSYSKRDFAALAVTILGVWLVGVEAGVMAGVATALGLFLWRTARPHYAIVGRVGNSEHFRNILRHAVTTHPALLCLRIDESLYFANARFLEDTVLAEVSDNPDIKHVILQCTAVNEVDASAMDALENLNRRLIDMKVDLHLTEVKGPVMDQLSRSHFLTHLSGDVHLTQFQAWEKLTA
ncbi:MAG: sulfate permease [Gammaproteobacteria bacterium]|nr:sulfate permease [Gammaproteobacteria bacterium]